MGDELRAVQQLVVTCNMRTGEINFMFPQNFILAMGMIEAAREAVMTSQVRPAIIPKLVSVEAIPSGLVKGN